MVTTVTDLRLPNSDRIRSLSCLRNSALIRGRPAAAEGAVELDDGEEFVAADLGEAEFGGEEFLFVVEDFEVL